MQIYFFIFLMRGLKSSTIRILAQELEFINETFSGVLGEQT